MDQGATTTGPSIDDIIGNAETYMGQTVTVEGEVEDVFGQRVFTMGGQGMMGDDLGATTDLGATDRQGATADQQGATSGNQDMTTGGQSGLGEQLIVLVTDTSGTMTSLDQYMSGDGVRVTGTVGEFNLAEIEADYNIDVPAELEAEVEEGDAVIFASQISASTGMNGGAGSQGLGTGNEGLGTGNDGLGTGQESDL